MIRSRQPNHSIICVVFALCPAPPGQAQSATVPKREHFQNAEVAYDWVQDSRGNRLRTFVTRPKSVVGKVPAIFFEKLAEDVVPTMLKWMREQLAK